MPLTVFDGITLKIDNLCHSAFMLYLTTDEIVRTLGEGTFGKVTECIDLEKSVLYCSWQCYCYDLTMSHLWFYRVILLHNLTARQNKSVLSLLRRLSTWRYPHLLQHGARSYRSMSAADVGIEQQTRRRPPLLLSIDLTDRRTDARPLHKPWSWTVWITSVTSISLVAIYKLASARWLCW